MAWELIPQELKALRQWVEWGLNDGKKVFWDRSNDPDAPNTLRVEYQIEGDIGMTIPEWVCFDHPEDSYAFKKALQWWDKHCLVAMAPQEEDRDLIDTVIASQEILTMPDSITAKQDGKFWKIIGRNVVQHKLLNEISLDDVPF